MHRTLLEVGNINNDIHIWDGVIGEEESYELHELAWDHNDRVESSIFTRRRRRSHRQGLDSEEFSSQWTVLEYAIDSILSNIELYNEEDDDKSNNSNDDHNYDDDDYDDVMMVEYWSRQHHMNVDVHSDVDEVQLLQDGTVRTPTNGHILYLIVGSEIQKPGAGGPTVLFPGKLDSWNTHHDNKNKNGDILLDLITIPAVDGRLVRFDGGMMHAVPCPPLRWMEDPNKVNNVHSNDNEDEDDEDYYDYDEDDEFVDEIDEEYLRSVLIFNTWWTKDGPPPQGVNPDPKSQLIPTGIEIGYDDDDDDDVLEFETNNEDDKIKCNDFTQWTKLSIQQPPQNNDASVPGYISLLGNEARRGYRYPNVPIIAPPELQVSLNEISTISRLTVLEKAESDNHDANTSRQKEVDE